MFNALALAAIVICQMVMNGVAILDSGLTTIMSAVGIASPQTQLAIMLWLCIFLVILAFRKISGIFGCLVLLVTLLMLLHRTIPGFGIAS